MTRALTQAAVEKLRPHPSKRLEVPDALLPGLYLIVQPSDAKSWAVRYRFRGDSMKHTLGTLAAFDLKKARESARDALGLVARARTRRRRRSGRGERRRTPATSFRSSPRSS